MNKQEFLKNIKATYEEGLKLLEKKCSDYAGDDNLFQNFENYRVAGVDPARGILTRVVDKISRISVLLDKEALVSDEMIEDTLLDAINYLAILKEYIGSKKE